MTPMLPARLLALVLALLVASCARVAGGADEFRSDDDPAHTVTADQVARRVIVDRDLRDHVGFLASDAMRGRGTGPELARVAAWIAERFALLGLDPAGEDGGYAQFWSWDGASPVGSAAGMAADSAAGPTHVPNVVAVLPGSDGARAGEYVILTAHFDHLGVGTPDEDGDSIFNGADDNASGTAALLAVAEAFAALPERPARPILFLATSGEEKGLLGSRHFAASPTVFLSEAVAVLNLDMIGRNSPDSVAVVGHAYSSLGPLLTRIAVNTDHLRLRVDPAPAGRNLFARSDHYPFARLGIPAVAVTSGLHEDYHRPADEAGRLDFDKMARVARLVFLAAHELATGTDAEWTDEGRAAVR